MSIISYALSGNFKNFSRKLDRVKEETKISKPRLMVKFLSCFIMIGSGYSDFLNYKLYKRSRKEIKEYATIKTQDIFYEIVSPGKYKEFFSIKANFLKNFAKYIDRDFFYMGSIDELKGFLNKHKEIMYKPVNGLAGKDVKKINTQEIEDIDAFYEEIKSKNILLDSYIKQHKSVQEFAPASVNTVRIMTFAYDGKSEIICAMMRFGNGVENVDNFHKGGMGVLVDIDTGKIISDAVDKDDNIFAVHPFSKKKFKGFQIPNWDIIKKTCLEAALVSDKIHAVGWDVVVTDKGCTFIEGNRRAGWDLPQVLYDRGRKDLMNYCLDKINAVEGTKYKV